MPASRRNTLVRKIFGINAASQEANLARQRLEKERVRQKHINSTPRPTTNTFPLRGRRAPARISRLKDVAFDTHMNLRGRSNLRSAMVPSRLRASPEAIAKLKRMKALRK
ncbi:MAG: hypothetical protein AABW59_02115 [archaeon]